MLTGQYPHPFPSLGNPDEAWAWYQENGPYAEGSEELWSHRLIFQPPGWIVPPWLTHRPRHEPPALD